MNVRWESFPDLRTGYFRYMNGGGNVFDALLVSEGETLEHDADAIVVARSPEAWASFKKDWLTVLAQWSLRQVLTGEDEQFLRACGVSWDKSPVTYSFA